MSDQEKVKCVVKYYDSIESDDPIRLVDHCIGGEPISREKYCDEVVNDLLPFLNLDSNSKFLDVGCGTGIFLSEVEKMVKSALGLEPSQNLIDNAICTSKIINGDPFSNELEGLKFTSILMYGVAPHFPSSKYFEDVVKHLYCNNLAPGGSLVVGDIPLNTRNSLMQMVFCVYKIIKKRKISYSEFYLNQIYNIGNLFDGEHIIRQPNRYNRNHRVDLIISKLK